MRNSNSTIGPLRRTSATIAVALAALLSGHAAVWAELPDIPTYTVVTATDPWTINAKTKAAGPGPFSMTGVYTLTDEKDKIIDAKVMLPDGPTDGHNWLSAGTLVGPHTLKVTFSGDCYYQSSSNSVTVNIPPAKSSQRDRAKINAAQGTRKARADTHTAKPRARPGVRAPIASGTIISTQVSPTQSHLEAKVYFSGPVSDTDAGYVRFDAEGTFLQSGPVRVNKDNVGSAIVFVPTSALVGYGSLRAQYFRDEKVGSSACVKL